LPNRQPYQLLHDEDLAEGFGTVYLPRALEKKYPNAHRDLIWQYVFPAVRRSIDLRSQREQRHHVNEKSLQLAVQKAVRAAGIRKAATCPPSGIPLPRIFSRPAMTSEQCRSYSGTRTCAPR